ncbi:MAG: carboxypeptidase-like regulatory domain-containing protein [Bacteroidaceae bacterium]|nr:carboxypeptidase-like regulatory domain-containing protein [Bacteroidaceae bacterium]MBQ6750407.1 carboxypeptidase-like regulatory domain-containing protein [Bacteroidaceae bacterium]
MRKAIFSILVIFFAVPVMGQRQKFQARVVDGVTGDPLPWVHVYVEEGRGTLTNAEGNFTIEANRDEDVKLSYVGYETQRMVAGKLPPVVKMKELIPSLSEVTVLSDVALLEQVAKRLSKDYRKYEKNTCPYFNRISITYNGMTEMVENFIEAHSAVNLRQIKLSSGQYWAKTVDGGKMHSSLTHSNLHKMMSLAPMTRGEDIWDSYIFPFPVGCKASYFEKYYHVSKETLTGDDGRLMYRFLLRRKNEHQQRMMSGTVYVDAETLGVLRFDGIVHGVPVALDLHDEEQQNALIDLHLQLNYDQAVGFAEVKDMVFEIAWGDLSFRSTLVNVAACDLPLTYGSPITGNLLETIADVGMNPEVEKEFAFIQRTDEEEELTEKEDIPMATTTVKYPKERVYLHLDNTSYFKGETIWFKAYVVRTDTWQRTNLSHVLYVELLNPSGDIVERRKLPIVRGEAYGDIQLDSLMITGFHEIRAYTRYMTNWGTHSCFSKVIPVFKTPQKEGDYSHPVIDQYSHQKRLPDERKDIEDNLSTSFPMVMPDTIQALATEDNIRITAATNYIKPCGKVELTIYTQPRSTLSVSVTDAATMMNARTGNIRTWMMQPTDTADLAPLQSKVQPIESRLNIHGRLTSRNQKDKADNITITAYLYNKMGQSMSGKVTTDSTGHYLFLLPDISGQWDLQLLSKKDGVAQKNYTIGIDRHFSPQPRKLLPEECQLTPVDTTSIWHWQTDDEPVLLTQREHVLQEVKVKARRRWTETKAWAHEENARNVSQVYYDCDEALDRIADEGQPLPTLAEWLKTKNSLFGGEDTPTDVLLMKSRHHIIGQRREVLDTRRGLDFTVRDSVMAYEDWLKEDVYPPGEPPEAVGYDISTPALWKRFYRDGLSYKRRPIVWVVDNQYVGITNWHLNGTYIQAWRSVCQAIDWTYCDNTTNTGDLPRMLDEMKSVYISEDIEALHRHIVCEQLDRMNPVVLYCFSHRKFKNPVNGLRTTHFQGFDESTDFPMEDYSILPPMPDYRRTLYWNPTVKTDSGGKAHIEFYNNSSCTDMFISVEGMTRDGKFIINE